MEPKRIQERSAVMAEVKDLDLVCISGGEGRNLSVIVGGDCGSTSASGQGIKRGEFEIPGETQRPKRNDTGDIF